MISPGICSSIETSANFTPYDGMNRIRLAGPAPCCLSRVRDTPGKHLSNCYIHEYSLMLNDMIKNYKQNLYMFFDQNLLDSFFNTKKG